jgi:predicted RNase H-like nuclease (RuvC/YqgF family)|tara:strand:- start:249 stop:758 length:510 start_codon:yes stop_codon:yes gene_type:complete
MSLAETELTIGGTSFKGVYIAILMSLATTLGGGVWTASSLYSRLESLEALEIPKLGPLEEKLLKAEQDLEIKIELIEQELTANDVSQLQGKLATLGVNLETIATQQAKLLTINEKVISLEKELESMRVTVTQAELIAKDLGDVDSKIKNITKEIEDLWSGMDYLSNPLN